jgi:ribosomal protein L40E
MEAFDLTPDPKVLIALTQTPMQPMDALCELIDNALDAFAVARVRDVPVKYPLVVIDLPRPSELRDNCGIIRVRDNGPGLTPEMAEMALRAGFSGNNPYDTLGLFGMGFNISTGKLGRVTRFITARQEEPTAIEVTVDLEAIQRARSFKVWPKRVDKPNDFHSGTMIEVSDWWPEGNANSKFVSKLVQYGLPTIRRELGRRYATVLRQSNVRIVVNEQQCEPFEHCHWSASRYVEHREHGRIPAVYRFDNVIGTQVRCTTCYALVPPEVTQCPACNSDGLRTIEERVEGWVGIQRFDHETDFGIDLVRNGRAIRIGEKSAFFEYVDEFKHVVKDYPVDSLYGRIIGEISLDHVPVDFLKQDFQRSSPEWQRAMSFVRGDTPLQPGKIKPGETNDSYIFKLYQGYRRVRTPGKRDMYMGYWDKDEDRPKRISRDKEREYYGRFLNREPGFYDDSEWWKLVENADRPPVEELAECPQCQAQNLRELDTCGICGWILIGKSCINTGCGEIIPQSALSCPKCGLSQVPEVAEPWLCEVCGRRNDAESSMCGNCGATVGASDPLSHDYLLQNSNKADDLSIPGCSVLLADGTYNAAIDVETFLTNAPIITPQGNKRLPSVTFKGEKIEIFLDGSHPLFKAFRTRPEQLVASEVALYLYENNRRFFAQQYQRQHTLSAIAWAVLSSRWSGTLEDNAEIVRESIKAFFKLLRDRLPALLGTAAPDYFTDLNEGQLKQLVDKMLDQGEDITKIEEMRLTGGYLRFIDEDVIVEIVSRAPAYFFDGGFWDLPYEQLPPLLSGVKQQVQQRTRSTYLNCLEDIAGFLKNRDPETILVQRARASLDFLQQKVV